MRLDATGQPLHTRALSIAITARADDRLDVAGSIVDLRKRGFVPVAGDLQGPGLIHDMRLAGTIDEKTMRRMNGDVDFGSRSVEDVAREFLANAPSLGP